MNLELAYEDNRRPPLRELDGIIGEQGPAAPPALSHNWRRTATRALSRPRGIGMLRAGQCAGLA
jgi:hypothetical protein